MESPQYTVTVIPKTKRPPQRRWFVAITTNQNVNSTPHTIASVIGNPNAPVTIPLNLDIQPLRRHHHVTENRRLLIVDVSVSKPESVFEPSDASATGPMSIRRMERPADEVLQLYFGERIDLRRIESQHRTTFHCRKRDEAKVYNQRIGLDIVITNNNPRKLTPEEEDGCNFVESFLDIMSPVRAIAIETSAGRKLRLDDWQKLRNFETRANVRIMPTLSSAHQMKTSPSTLEKMALSIIGVVIGDNTLVARKEAEELDEELDEAMKQESWQASYRAMGAPPKTNLQFKVLQMLREYRDTAASLAQQTFIPPRVTIYKPDPDNPRRKRGQKMDVIDMLFYDMNYFCEIPIVCCMMDLGAIVNEMFWLNMLATVKFFAENNGSGFDPKVGWVHLLTLINAAGMCYALELIDIYREVWYTRSGDCDESFQAVQLHQIFTRTKFTNHELIKLQSYAMQYYPFCAFWYATTPSANDKSQAEGGGILSANPAVSDGEPIGHMSAMFIKKAFFDGMMSSEAQPPPEEDDSILLGEGTSLMAPKLGQTVPVAKYYTYADKLSQRSVTSHMFYTRLMGLYTPVFLEDVSNGMRGIHSFLCFSDKAAKLGDGRAEIGIHAAELIKHPEHLKLFAYPRLDRAMVDLCYKLADGRTYCPNLLFEKDIGCKYFTGLAPVAGCLTTNEDADARFDIAVGNLKRVFKLRPNAITRTFTTEPLDPLNPHQPKIFAKQIPTSDPGKPKSLTFPCAAFTVDDLIFSGDAIVEISNVMKDFDILEIRRVALIKMMELVIVTFCPRNIKEE